jgi:hypothetical protein
MTQLWPIARLAMTDKCNQLTRRGINRLEASIQVLFVAGFCKDEARRVRKLLVSDQLKCRDFKHNEQDMAKVTSSSLFSLPSTCEFPKTPQIAAKRAARACRRPSSAHASTAASTCHATKP